MDLEMALEYVEAGHELGFEFLAEGSGETGYSIQTFKGTIHDPLDMLSLFPKVYECAAQRAEQRPR